MNQQRFSLSVAVMKNQRDEKMQALAKSPKASSCLSALRNVGPAALNDFALLGVATVEQLAQQKADDLYVRLCLIRGAKQDPCVHDVFSAAIHQAVSAEALDWWQFTARRKARQLDGSFPTIYEL